MHELAAQVLQFGIFGALAYIGKTGTRLAANVNELNQKMAVMLERMTSHDKTLDDHGDRIHALEVTKRPGGR